MSEYPTRYFQEKMGYLKISYLGTTNIIIQINHLESYQESGKISENRTDKANHEGYHRISRMGK